MPEHLDGLANAIFVNCKILFAQIGREPAFPIADSRLQDHEIDIDGDLIGLSRCGEHDRKKEWDDRQRAPRLVSRMAAQS